LFFLYTTFNKKLYSQKLRLPISTKFSESIIFNCIKKIFQYFSQKYTFYDFINDVKKIIFQRIQLFKNIKAMIIRYKFI